MKSAQPLKGHTAIVTGGSRGVGHGIAKALAGAGGSVLICGRDEVALKNAVEELSGDNRTVACMVADVRKYDDCRRLVQEASSKFGKIDMLVNNAGVTHKYVPVDCIDPETWDATIETNLSGTFYCCREVVPIMRKQGSGYIFNISSVASHMLLPGGSAYNASKCGLSGFTETLAKDVRFDGIRVSEIVMGSASTPTRGVEDWKLEVEDVADIILHLYAMPVRAMVPRVEIRPTRAPDNR